MSNTTEKKYHQTIDFDALMQTAREHITALAGNIWSDHNISDPGITQMEVLAFCIADLSYRTSFGIDDIMAGYKGGEMTPYDLPLADVILPNNPVTIKDLRKILIDMPHPFSVKSNQLLLRNAFPTIAEKTEIPFFSVSPDGKETVLSYRNIPFFEALQKEVAQSVLKDKDLIGKEVAAKRIKGVTGAATSATAANVAATAAIDGISKPIDYTTNEADYEFVEQLELNGLYSIQLEFEQGEREKKNDDGDLVKVPRHVWDLNQNYFEQTVQTNSGKAYTVSVLLPYWDDIKWSLKDEVLASANLAYAQRKIKDNLTEDYFIAVDKLNYDDYFYDYYAELQLNRHLLNAFVKLNTKQTGSVLIGGKNCAFTIDFLDWNELSNGVKRDYNMATPKPADANLAINLIQNVSIDGDRNVYDISTVFSFDKNGKTKSINLLARIRFDSEIIFTVNDFQEIDFKLRAEFYKLYAERIEIEDAINKVLVNNNAAIFSDYQNKLKRVFDYVYGGTDNVWSYLGKYRNLCEDYSKFTASRVQEVALFGKLIVTPNYNLNELLAEVYFRVDQFLNPLIKFKTLSEMTEKGHSFEQLFNGPLLKNGFVADADLDNLKRRSVVYTSDLIRIIMDVPGVEAVEDFNISSYIDNRLMGRNVINCLSLTNSKIYKPRLSFEKSGLEVCVNAEMQVIDSVFIESWYIKKLADFKLDQVPSNAIDLSLPMGLDMEIEAYKSIQHDFPEIYGIGEYGLPIDATEERKANAKQLKAYLLPFEQLMANYLKQVAHLPELFSFNRSLDSTYATQPLYDVPDVQPLFQGFVNSNDTWQTFKDDVDNSYETELKKGESSADFKNRRSRFLSHLLSRFGESFTAYAQQMFDQHKALLDDPLQIGNYQTKREETLTDLIEDKIAFGEDHEKVSSERYKSFDMSKILPYQANGVWNNSNIESYKLRLCRLLGIDKVDNTFIFGAATDDTGQLIDVEGMHIVEHILLRPRIETNDFIDVVNRNVTPDGTVAYDADKDPYSFKITVVLPRYAGRFKRAAFRKFTEELIRMETPAHILVQFNWMSSSCGKKFEKDYSEWKKGVHVLKPYFFQNIQSVKDLQTQDLFVNPPNSLDPNTIKTSIGKGQVKAIAATKKAKLTRKAEPVKQLLAVNYGERLARGPFILDLQDNLVNRLNTPCKLDLKVYDFNEIIINPVNGAVRFENKKTDVYNVRVSEIGGTLTLYRWNNDSKKWQMKLDYANVPSLYFNVGNFIKSGKGLTAENGGTGTYRLVYQLEGVGEVTQIIEVTKEIIPVHIYIGWKKGDAGEMLAFNTETDGVFCISNKTWEGYFLQFSPSSLFSDRLDGLFGNAFISSPSKGLAPTALATGKTGVENVLLSDIYTEYGKGLYHITYELDGQTTYVDIELKIELSISVFNKDLELLANQNNTVVVPANVQLVDVFLDLPNGTLKVYDLNAVSIKNPSGELGKEELLDENPFGTYAYYKKIGLLQIDRAKDLIYKAGGEYLFLYEFEGMSSQINIHFLAPKLELPTIKLFNGDKEVIERPFVIPIGDEETNHNLFFQPIGAAVLIEVMVGGERKILESFTVTEANQRLEVTPLDLYGEFGEGPIFVTCKNDAGTAALDFTMKLKRVEPNMVFYQNEGVIAESPIVINQNDGSYGVILNLPGGQFVLYNVNGEELYRIEAVSERQLTIPLDPWVSLGFGRENTFIAQYTLDGTVIDIPFEIMLKGDPVVTDDTVLVVSDLSTEKQVEEKNKEYLLVFDYTNREHVFQFKFNNGPGELIVIDDEGFEYNLEVESDYFNFNGVDELARGLKTGIYEMTYQPSTGSPLSFMVNVININPIFSLSEIQQLDSGVYNVVAVPKYPDARTYIWRLNDKYKSRAKMPRLKLDFTATEKIIIELTMHYDDYEKSYELEVTEAYLLEFLDAS